MPSCRSSEEKAASSERKGRRNQACGENGEFVKEHLRKEKEGRRLASNRKKIS